MFKKDHGFTLVELLVTIVVGALVTLAATTVILMGLRLNRQSMDTASRHNTARILLTALEEMASDGSISGFRMDYEDWEIYGKAGEADVIYEYDAENHVISTKDAPIMKDVLSSYLEYEDGLLTISVETEEGIFNSTVYCRMAISPSGMSGSDKEEDTPPTDNVDTPPTIQVSGIEDANARKAFLEILSSQYRITKDKDGTDRTPMKNHGVILEDGKHTGQYYSEWYITSTEEGKEAWEAGIWNSATPWCACFITWGVDEAYKLGATDYKEDEAHYRPSFAGVDSFMAYFQKSATDNNKWYTSEYWCKEDETPYIPLPGDIVFYDWVFNEERNPQHVGVVLGITDEDVKNESGEVVDKISYVYTIEGNVSGGLGDVGIIGLRRYRADDPRILGYGVLDWKTDEELAKEEIPQ